MYVFVLVISESFYIDEMLGYMLIRYFKGIFIVMLVYVKEIIKEEISVYGM